MRTRHRRCLVSRQLLIGLGILPLAIVLAACSGGRTQPAQATSSMPTVSLVTSPTVRSASVVSLTPTIMPTVSPPVSGGLSWLTPSPPAAIEWKTYQGQYEDKNFAFSYQYSYPADWFIYPHGVQSFAEFDLATPRPLDDFPKAYTKIDVGFVICVSPEAIASEDCHPTDTPITIAGLPGSASVHPDDVVPGLEIREVNVRQHEVVFKMDAFLFGDPDQIKAYEQIFGYMVSTLKFDP